MNVYVYVSQYLKNLKLLIFFTFRRVICKTSYKILVDFSFFLIQKQIKYHQLNKKHEILELNFLVILKTIYNTLVKRIYCNTISAFRNSYLSDSNENMYHFLHKNRLYRWAPLTVVLEEPLKNFSSVRYFSFPVFQPSVHSVAFLYYFSGNNNAFRRLIHLL